MPANGQLVGGTLNIGISPGSSTKTTDAYLPSPVSIDVGTTVKWRNDDSTPHTVTSGANGQPDGRFDSSPNFNPLLAPRQTYTHTFQQEGNFPYYCGLHPNMVGTVIVVSSENVTLDVKAEHVIYGTNEDIVITGRLWISGTPDQVLLLEVMEPDGKYDRRENIEVDKDGNYAYSFNAAELTKNGTYTVFVSYKTTTKQTTFEFHGGKELDWKPINANIEGTNHQIEYMITGTGNTLDKVTGDVETITLLAEITAKSDGTLFLRFNEELMDTDYAFAVIIDDMIGDDAIAGSGETHTIEIDFKAGTEQVEIVGDGVPYRGPVVPAGGKEDRPSQEQLERCQELGISAEKCNDIAILQSEQIRVRDMKMVEYERQQMNTAMYLVGVGAVIAGIMAFFTVKKRK
jgi:plastocyanin